MNRFLCFLLGHRYHVKQTFGRWSRRVECLQCKREWAMNDDVQSLVPWTDEAAKLYELMGYRILK